MRVVCSHCRKAFSAPDRWKGQHVECPSCGQVTRAEDSPGASSAKPSRGLAENAAPSTTHRDRSTGGSKPRAAVPVSDEDDELRLLPEEDSKRPKVWVGDLEVDDTGSAGQRRSPSGSAAAPRSRTQSVARAGAAPASSGTTEEAKDCPNCGARLPPDGMYCIECGYHMGLKRVLHGDLSDLDLDLSVGYVRWFRRQMEEGESPAGILWLLHILVAIVLSVVGVVGHPRLWALVGLVALGYAAFWLWILKLGGVHLLGRWFWNWRLFLLRRFVWSRLESYQILRPESRAFADSDLAAVENLEELRVLDAEGTALTDRALLTLQYCKRLQAAVVRGTRMTRDGVLRLQIMMPHLSIWHDD